MLVVVENLAQNWKYTKNTGNWLDIKYLYKIWDLGLAHGVVKVVKVLDFHMANQGLSPRPDSLFSHFLFYSLYGQIKKQQ